MARLSLMFCAVLLGASFAAHAIAGPIADGATAGTRVEALELKADGAGMMTLTLKIYNDTDKALNLVSKMIGESAGDSRDVSGIYIIDSTNKKRYLTVKDTSGKCVCALIQSDVPAKGSLSIWAKFAATPATVKTVTAVVPMFLPLDGVAVTGP